MESTSGRSSRSTLIETNSRFISAAVSSSSNDSRSMTWHQWQAAYPTDRKIGLSSASALPRASSPQGYQSTGLFACWRRYGLVSFARRLAIPQSLAPIPLATCRFSRRAVDADARGDRAGHPSARRAGRRAPLARRATPGAESRSAGRLALRADGARARDPAPSRRWDPDDRHRGLARYQPDDGAEPPQEHPREARRPLEGRGGPTRLAPRPRIGRSNRMIATRGSLAPRQERSSATRVAIAAGHPVIRGVARLSCASIAGIEVVGEASTVVEVVELCRRQRVD